MQDGAGPRPFDVATRRLIEQDPVGWLTWLGLPVDGPVTPRDSEVSTVLAEVDKVLEVAGPQPWLAHIELQSSRDPTLPDRMLEYHVVLRKRDHKPVESMVVLLRKDADGPELQTGQFDQYGVRGNRTVSFWFGVVRIWECSVETLLSGGIGVLPPAPIAAVEQRQLPEIIRQMEERFESEAPPGRVGELWAATDLLMGLRYDKNLANYLLRGVRGMRESSTYQAILEEGREEGIELGEVRNARRLILELGTDKFGEPDTATVTHVASIGDLTMLNHLVRSILRTSSWDDLLATGDS